MPNQCFYCDNQALTKAQVYDVDLAQTLIVDICKECLQQLEDGIYLKLERFLNSKRKGD